MERLERSRPDLLSPDRVLPHPEGTEICLWVRVERGFAPSPLTFS